MAPSPRMAILSLARSPMARSPKNFANARSPRTAQSGSFMMGSASPSSKNGRKRIGTKQQESAPFTLEQEPPTPDMSPNSLLDSALQRSQNLIDLMSVDLEDKTQILDGQHAEVARRLAELISCKQLVDDDSMSSCSTGLNSQMSIASLDSLATSQSSRKSTGSSVGSHQPKKVAPAPRPAWK